MNLMTKRGSEHLTKSDKARRALKRANAVNLQGKGTIALKPKSKVISPPAQLSSALCAWRVGQSLYGFIVMPRHQNCLGNFGVVS